ncbi:MAG: single-stranded DNA-binding protein [Bacilli bacterium]|nr:single-stranded DNA-binding protein [Bacilli bacterium]
MQNIVFLIGRLASEPELKKTENSKDYSTITVAVPRSFKNPDGLYETDFIRCNLWNGIATNVNEYCHKGDLVGIKGRIQVRSYQDNEDTKYITEIIVDKVSFLSSKKVVEE